jgi:hypothetical protein
MSSENRQPAPVPCGAGAHAKAVELLDRAVTMGFYAADYYERLSPFFVDLRERDDFARTLERARQRQTEFAAAVEQM